MDKKQSLSKEMNDLIAFLETLPGVKNLRVYTGEELLQIGDVSPNPRKFREAPFCVFFAKTFHNWPEKREVFDVNHGQVRVGWTQIRLSKAS